MYAIPSRASLVILAALMLIAACSAAPSPSVDPSVPPSPVPSEAAFPDLAWERVEAPAPLPNSAIVDIEAFGPGYVALISTFEGSAILTSSDGRDWTVGELPNGAHAGLAAMVVSDGLLVAVGRDTTDVDANLGVVWLSEDGIAWRQAPGAPYFGGVQLIDVVATQTGFVAIGGYPALDVAAVFTSPDGEEWTASGADLTFEQAFMWAVAETDTGLVATGWRRNPDPAIGFDPAFWTSSDGLEWELASAPDGSPGAQVRDVVAGDGVMIAVGDLVQGGEGFVWTSTDGTVWELVDTNVFEVATVAEVERFRGGFLALGGRNGDDGGMWFFADGAEWTAIEDPAFVDAYLVEMLEVEDGLIAVGATQTQVGETGSYETAPAVWYGSSD